MLFRPLPSTTFFLCILCHCSSLACPDCTLSLSLLSFLSTWLLPFLNDSTLPEVCCVVIQPLRKMLCGWNVRGHCNILAFYTTTSVWSSWLVSTLQQLIQFGKYFATAKFSYVQYILFLHNLAASSITAFLLVSVYFFSLLQW